MHSRPRGGFLKPLEFKTALKVEKLNTLHYMSWKDNTIGKYVADSIAEMKKVVWPTRQETVNHTLLVIGISLGVAAFIGAADYLLNLGIEQIIR